MTWKKISFIEKEAELSLLPLVVPVAGGLIGAGIQNFLHKKPTTPEQDAADAKHYEAPSCRSCNTNPASLMSKDGSGICSGCAQESVRKK